MKKLYWSLALLLIVIASLFLVFKTDIPIPSSDTTAKNQDKNQITKEGFTIAMAIEAIADEAKKPTTSLLESQPARLKFTIQNATNNQAVKGLHPAVWLEQDNPKEKALSCKERINSYLQSQIGFKPEVSLNSYFVLAMNNNPSISVIDPLNGFGGSRLLTRIKLSSPASDWVISKDHKKLYVLTPLTHQVVLVDTETWKVIKSLNFKTKPTRLALQPDDNYLWVGLESVDEQTLINVNVVDAEALTISKSLTTGVGHHEFAFSNDSQTAYISNQKDASISIVDIGKLAITQTLKTDSAITSLAFSELSKSAYAVTEKGKLLIISDNTIHTELNAGSALNMIRFSADGRWGFALSQTANKVFIIDVSTNQIAHTLDLGDQPDQVSLTDHFAYIHSVKNETVNMIQLDSLTKGTKPAVTNFQGGQTAPGKTETDAIVPTPERNAVVIANPSDKTVYYYMEGMAAPMGNFENQGLKPMSVIIVNRSMQETAPGVYSAITQLPTAGHYNVSILLDNPAIYHCFTTDIAPNPALVKQSGQPVKVEYLLDSKEVIAGTTVPIKIKLSHPEQQRIQDSVTDLQVMFFQVPGQSQQRMIAKAQGNGIYQVEVTPKDVGIYQLFVQSATLNFTFTEQPSLLFRAVKTKTTK